MEATHEQQQAFGEALTALTERAGLTLGDLAKQLGVSYEAVRNYSRGAREPSREQVFRLEEALDAKPGTLSRYLGYLPVTAQKARAVSVLEAVESDPRLTPRLREALSATYRALVGEG